MTYERVGGGRFALIAALVGRDARSVLDVGCRDRALRRHLPAAVEYVGVDLAAPADVIASAEEPLPFAAAAFDVVVLADVLEHLDDPHSALDEAMRIARGGVVILLPNMFSLLHRVQFARGRMSNAKYGFGPQNPVDRHRWLMNVDQAHAFADGRAAAAGWQVVRACAHDAAWRRPSARLAYGLARRAGSPNLWAWEYAARLEPR